MTLLCLITLTDMFQYQSKFIDTDNITQWDQRKYNCIIKITYKTERRYSLNVLSSNSYSRVRAVHSLVFCVVLCRLLIDGTNREINKGNNKITELRTILLRESQIS